MQRLQRERTSHFLDGQIGLIGVARVGSGSPRNLNRIPNPKIKKKLSELEIGKYGYNTQITNLNYISIGMTNETSGPPERKSWIRQWPGYHNNTVKPEDNSFLSCVQNNVIFC